jgi:hypothetical protein
MQPDANRTLVTPTPPPRRSYFGTIATVIQKRQFPSIQNEMRKSKYRLTLSTLHCLRILVIGLKMNCRFGNFAQISEQVEADSMQRTSKASGTLSQPWAQQSAQVTGESKS